MHSAFASLLTLVVGASAIDPGTYRIFPYNVTSHAAVTAGKMYQEIVLLATPNKADIWRLTPSSSSSSRDVFTLTNAASDASAYTEYCAHSPIITGGSPAEKSEFEAVEAWAGDEQNSTYSIRFAEVEPALAWTVVKKLEIQLMPLVGRGDPNQLWVFEQV